MTACLYTCLYLSVICSMLGPANISMVNPNQMNSSNSNQQTMFQPPFVINNNGGQDPHSMGMSMGMSTTVTISL